MISFIGAFGLLGLIYGGLFLLFSKTAKVMLYFSKFTVGLLIAAILSDNLTPVTANGMLNLLFWAGIVLLVCFLLGFLPRFNASILFCCNLLITMIIGHLVILEIVETFFPSFERPPLISTMTSILSVIFSFLIMLRQLGGRGDLRHAVLRCADWLLASLLYAFLIYGVADQYVSVPKDNVAMFLVFIGVCGAVLYAGDLVVFPRLLALAAKSHRPLSSGSVSDAMADSYGAASSA